MGLNNLRSGDTAQSINSIVDDDSLGEGLDDETVDISEL